jgi:hypothetical protein
MVSGISDDEYDVLPEVLANPTALVDLHEVIAETVNGGVEPAGRQATRRRTTSSSVRCRQSRRANRPAHTSTTMTGDAARIGGVQPDLARSLWVGAGRSERQALLPVQS